LIQEVLENTNDHPTLIPTYWEVVIHSSSSLIEGIELIKIVRVMHVIMYATKTPKLGFRNRSLFMKDNSLFVLLVCHVDIAQTKSPLAMFLVFLESPWNRMHEVDFFQ
jgi:hypothetical protein